MWISSLIDVVLHWSKPYAVDDAASRAQIVDQLLYLLAGLRPDRLLHHLIEVWSSKRAVSMDWTGITTCQRQDLIEELRSVGDFRWTVTTQSSSQNPSTIDSEELKKRVMQSQRISDVIWMLLVRKDEKRSEAELQSEVRRILEEMGHKYSINYIRLMGLILIKTSRRMYEHIWIDLRSVRLLKSLFEEKDVPVILMPTHRSYIDFLLISFVAFHYGLPLPLIASGVDFMGMTGVGEVLRKAGAFFIRRTFADDELYRTVFAAYIYHILHQPQPLEFFVEGTRSRSGKSLYPKFGLLQAAVEVYLAGRVPDIMIVPVGITYERTVEESLFAKELLGLPKPRETTSGLLKASQTVLTDNYGSIWFRCGAPISVRDFMKKRVDRAVHNTSPRNRFKSTVDGSGAVRDLALQVVAQQQDLIEIHDWAVLASVLLNRLRTTGTTSFPVDELVGGCQKLLSALLLISQTKDDRNSDRRFEAKNLIRCTKIHLNILQLDSKQGTLWIQQSHLSDMRTLHLRLAHYRNHIVNLVAPSVLFRLASEKSQVESLNSFEFLKQLFSREFVIPEISHDYTNVSGEIHELFSDMVEPFLVGYAMVLRLLQSDAVSVQTSFASLRELVKSLQGDMKKVLDAGVYCGFEILSSDLISNCVQAVKCLEGISVQNGQFQIDSRIVDRINLQFLSLLPLKIVFQLADMSASSDLHVYASGKI
ncbi:hypothetical protein RvY_02925 [Ramazzottius varieornatus]|uniref:Phospholipid/glycerol acyltransferase domain-containing protein n=1 Tax=Ramazzottius varieornatus TaxID=947166 RepID=A0A1D1ULB4_RAMVA|nr:hypothetical protein RvY_02925 [Ramazzottius varieornatus]